MRSRRSRRSRRSLKLSHTQTSVPCGTLNNCPDSTEILDKNQQFLLIWHLLTDEVAQNLSSLLSPCFNSFTEVQRVKQEFEGETFQMIHTRKSKKKKKTETAAKHTGTIKMPPWGQKL